MAITRPHILNFLRTGIGGACYIDTSYPGNIAIDVYGIGILSNADYQDVVLVGSDVPAWISLDFSAFMLGPVFWDIEVPCTVFAVARDTITGECSPPSLQALPALINIQPITFTVDNLRRSPSFDDLIFDVVGMPNPERDRLVVMYLSGTSVQIIQFVGDGTKTISGVGGLGFVTLVMLYVPDWSYTISGIVTLEETRKEIEMVQYTPHTIVKGRDDTLLVPLFDVANAPLVGIPGSELTIKLASVTGVQTITTGATAVWTELSEGYYALLLDGVTFLNTIGTYQLDIKHPDAVPVRYVLDVVATDPESGTFYDIVRDGQGTPVPDVEVTVYEHGTTNLLYTTRTYVNGQFSIPLSAVAPITLVDIVFVPTGQPSFRRDGVVLT